MIRDIIQPLRGQLEEYFYTQDNRQASEAHQAIDLAQDTVMYGLRREVMHDNAAGLLSLFAGDSGAKSYAVTSAIASDYANRLHTQLNVPANVAEKIAVHVIPAVLQAITSYVTVNDTVDSNKLGDVIAGDLGTLRGSLEAGMQAARARGLGEKATGILGFGIGGKYDLSGLGNQSNPRNQ